MKPIPSRPDIEDRGSSGTAEVVLYLFGGLALLSIPLGVLGAVLAGDAQFLLGWRSAGVFGTGLAIGLWCILVAKQLAARRKSSRLIAFVTLLVLSAASILMAMWLVNDESADRHGYGFLGGWMMALMGIGGLISVLLPARPRS